MPAIDFTNDLGPFSTTVHVECCTKVLETSPRLVRNPTMDASGEADGLK